MRSIAQEGNIFGQILPVDLGAGANAPFVRLDVKNYEMFEILIYKAAGIAAEPVVATLQQHNASTAGTSKALPISNGIYVKTGTNMQDATAFTRENPDAAPNDNRYTGTTSIQKAGVILIPIHAAELDVSNGFRWFSLSIADTG